jgi:hypothetical protein
MAYRTRIEMVETVTKHLLAQGARSTEAGDNPNKCLYRSPLGLQCAIGCLIPDDKYKDRFEDPGNLNPDILEAANIDPADLPLAYRLQKIHDHMMVWEWPEALEDLRQTILSPITL